MFTPLKIAGMEVKNRTFMAPMSLGYESQDGTVNEKMEAYWLRRAQGGVGCIIVDATSAVSYTHLSHIQASKCYLMIL